MAPKKRSKVYQRTFIGCWTCRRRKIKCDATRPNCLRCAKSKLQCEGYDVKLNWSNPLVVKNGEMIFNDDNEEDESATTFQRSNIALCKWNLYKFYEDIDDDLERLEDPKNKKDCGKVGPFVVFRYKLTHESLSPVLSVRNRLSPKGREASRSPTPSMPLTKPVSPSPFINHTIHPFLEKFAKITIFARGLNESVTPLVFPLPLKMVHPKIDFNRVLQPLIQHYEDSITISPYFRHSINHFMTLIPHLFQNKSQEFINYIQQTVRSSLGELVLHRNDQDLQLLLCIATVSLLNQIDQNQASSSSPLLSEIIQLFNAASQLPSSTTSESSTLSLVLQIMISTTLGIYDPRLFQYPVPPHSNSTIFSIYKFHCNSNILLNSSQFQLDNKYSKFYEDLSQSYNLLKNIKTKPKKKDLKNGYGVILIQPKETPRDQIIRVPKYIEEGEEDDEDDVPPSFLINFSHAEDESSGEEDEDEDDDRDNEEEEGESLDDDHHLKNDTNQEQNENEQSTAVPLFTFDVLSSPLEESSLGISNCLFYLFEELAKLINHKRIFTALGMSSRNFPRVCADFEDVLHKASGLIENSTCCNDTKFYNCLILLYYKLVLNYPSHLLKYHFNALSKVADDGNELGLIWFVKIALGSGFYFKEKNNRNIWCNNWEAKQLLYELRQRNNSADWATTMKSENLNDFFVL